MGLPMRDWDENWAWMGDADGGEEETWGESPPEMGRVRDERRCAPGVDRGEGEGEYDNGAESGVVPQKKGSRTFGARSVLMVGVEMGARGRANGREMDRGAEGEGRDSRRRLNNVVGVAPSRVESDI